MEKTDVREKLDEMKRLSLAGKHEAAADIADTILWRKSHNINVMVRIAKAYEAVGRLDECEEILEFAYDRSPVARMVVYELAMLDIKRGKLEAAQIYYDDFVELAPHDSLKYVIKYHLAVAKRADDSTLIAILEQLKEDDFSEEWAYELANLYHKVGDAEKCIDICDQIILWFGDGPYVERALEMKMCYQPLSEQQEDKYRQIRSRRDGITEIHPADVTAVGGNLDQTIRIPEIQPPSEKFDTVNLQAEIRKDIENIMNATASKEVDENMENIKALVEDIPYLQPDLHVTGSLPEEIEEEKKINENIEDRFKTLLAEESDGQVSMLIPDENHEEEQIEGQLTIDEMMQEWEKTRRAASATLREAEAAKLEIEKARALREANNIMEKLVDASEQLEAGVPSAELIKGKVLFGTIPPVSDAASAMSKLGTGFTVPRVTPQGDEEGLVIPVLTKEEAATAPLPDLSKYQQSEVVDAMMWKAPELESDETEPVAEVPVPTVPVVEPPVFVAPVTEPEVEIPVMEMPLAEVPENNETTPLPALDTDLIADIMQQEMPVNNETTPLPALDTDFIAGIMNAEEEVPEQATTIQGVPVQETPIQAAPNQAAPVQNVFVAPKADVTPVIPADIQQAPVLEAREMVREEDLTSPLPKIEEVYVEPEVAGELITEEKLEGAVIESEIDGITITSLTEGQKKHLSYFASVKGLEPQLCSALSGAMTRIESHGELPGGNLILAGDAGCGKTMLGTAFIKIMQDTIGKPTGKIGKLSGKTINEKDLGKLFSQVADGALIIEKARYIQKDTAEKLAEIISSRLCKVYVILEDEADGIRKALSHSPAFAACFTEKVLVPGLADRDLVEFARAYALEHEFSIDEMGTLALYNRIKMAKNPTKNTTITAVKTIMDEAMEKESKGGIKGFFQGMSSKRYDEDGNIVLREKDFEE